MLRIKINKLGAVGFLHYCLETTAGGAAEEQSLGKDGGVVGAGKSESTDEIVPGVCFYSPFSPTIYSHYSEKPGEDRRKRGNVSFKVQRKGTCASLPLLGFPLKTPPGKVCYRQ